MPIAEDILRQAPRRTAATALCGAGWSITYGELMASVADARTTLRDRFRSPGTLALAMVAMPRSIAMLLAAQLLGHLTVLMPPVLSARERADILRLSGAWWLVTGPGAPGERWLRLPGRRVPDAGDFIGQLTSGSTGASRVAVRTDPGVSAEIAAVSSRLGLEAGSGVVCASSTAHSYGLIAGLLAPLAAAGTVTLAQPRDVSWTQSPVRGDVLVGLPGTYAELLKSEIPPAHLPAILLSAGSHLPVGLNEAFSLKFGRPILQDYGTTETGTIAIDRQGCVPQGCVGTPLQHVQVRIARVADVPLEDREAGEIEVRSIATARGYLRPDGIAPCTTGGWYRTRDAGWMVDGLLFVGRRLREAIVTDAGPVLPEQIERAISVMPGVIECVAVQVSDGPARSRVKVIAVAPGLRPHQIREWCKRHLDARLVPSRVQIVRELPRSPAGKILQKYLL